MPFASPHRQSGPRRHACVAFVHSFLAVLAIASVRADQPLPASPADSNSRMARTAEAVRRIIEALPPSTTPPAFCFAADVTETEMRRLWEFVPQLDPRSRYQATERWPGTRGEPIELSWSFVPDGLPIGNANSALFNRMDSLYVAQGGRATWIGRIEAAFARWAELSGTSYIRVQRPGGGFLCRGDCDDGAAWGSQGAAGLRGDVRIAMRQIDGPGAILAFNLFPPDGDMVLDSGENWASAAGLNLFLRNVVMHEHGHGLGFQHVCPADRTKLMEPFFSADYDGPRHDDLRGVQRLYGDDFEENDSIVTAAGIGVIEPGTPLFLGIVPAPPAGLPPSFSANLSIDGDGDQDFYRFTVTGPRRMVVTVAPQGLLYENGAQGTGGACQSGDFVDSAAVANLDFQVIAVDQSTVLATVASNPAGVLESRSNILLAAPGDYYLRVYESGAPAESQLYNVTMAVSVADLTPPQPNPMVFTALPVSISPSQITMTAATAFDADSPPTQYLFDFTVGGAGGTDSLWQASTLYIDSGLSPNTLYAYQVKARDSAQPPNETAFSAAAAVHTLADVPPAPTLGPARAGSMRIDVLAGLNPPGTELAIICVASLPVDAHWNGRLADASGEPAAEATWRTDGEWGELWLRSLGPETVYTFAVMARNLDLIETAPGPGQSLMTATGPSPSSLP